MTTLKLALDWRPNTNHTGFFVAQYFEFYEKEQIRLEIISAEEDNYKLTPAKKVELGEADFALCPTESLVSYRTKQNPFDAIALATIFQEDISAICTLRSSGISRPKQLDHKVYASYKARYEDRIVEQMVKNDGGKGLVKLSYPDKLGIWNTLLSGKADATWIFVNWEGVEAEGQQVDLNLFKMSDFGIPYGYSPVIMASEQRFNKHSELYHAFIRATKKGFQYAISNYENSAAILKRYISEDDKCIDLVKSQIMTSHCYGDPHSWGYIDERKMQTFLDWLYKQKLTDRKLKSKDLLTNTLLQN